MDTKPLHQSKTFWTQVAAVVGALFPAIAEWIATNPVAFTSIFAAINVIIRFVTHGRVRVFGDGGNGSGPAIMRALIIGFAVIITFAAVACAPIASGLTGQPLQTQSLATERGRSLEVISEDVRDAEVATAAAVSAGREQPIYGLYSASALRDRVRRVMPELPVIDVVAVK